MFDLHSGDGPGRNGSHPVTLDPVSGHQTFGHDFDDEFPVGPLEGNRAFFGLEVLRGLTEGIDDFINVRQSRWELWRSGPALLGTAMWINDPELILKLGQLSAACVVVTKQPHPRKPHRVQELKQLEAFNEGAPGLPTAAFPDLSLLAPKVEGERLIVGPGSGKWESVVPTIRTLGYRPLKSYVPLVHAKLVLLGNLWWHDEDVLGYPADVFGFEARRLWVSSANFTRSSRRNLEFGYWTEDPALVAGAERFLLGLIAASEGVNPEADIPTPDLAEVDFDDQAIAEYLAEHPYDEEDEDADA